MIGALTTFVAGAGHITSDRIGWFVLAATVGFAWLAVADFVLPDDPVRSLQRSVHAFYRRAGDTVANVVDTLERTRDGDAPDDGGEALRKNIERVRSCRTLIDNQFLGAEVLHSSGRHVEEELRVALYSAQRGVEDMVDQVDDPRWISGLTDDLAVSITATLEALAAALRDGVDTEAMDAVADQAQKLRDHIHDAMTGTAKLGDASGLPPETVVAALTTIGGAELVAQSTSETRGLTIGTPDQAGAAGAEGDASLAQASVDSLSPRRTPEPSTALALQAVVAAVVAGLIAQSVGIEQHLVVAFAAFLVIAGSAGESTRRAWTRLVSTILGAVGGVAIAASVPHNVVWAVGVVTVGVFFAIFSAPVSYAAMVFWMSIAIVPLFASKGLYLELVRDKAVAALIGGCVAAVVALTVAPIRLSRDFRPAVLHYLDALDTALEAHLPGQAESRPAAVSELDRAHSELDSIAESAATEIRVFAQTGNILNEQVVQTDAVHEAFLRLTPLLPDSSRRLHGWTDQQVEMGIHRLRDAVEAAKASARSEAAPVNRSAPADGRTALSGDDTGIELAESLWRVENLHARLAELALVLGGRPGSPAPAH